MSNEILSKGLTKSFNDIDHELTLIPRYTNLKLDKHYITMNNKNYSP